MDDLETLIRNIAPSCLVRADDSRYYATQEGAARLENHLKANGIELKVIVTPEGRFDVLPRS